MPATPFDSAIWRSVFHDRNIATLFTDTAVLRAELLVMGTLALAQAKAGQLPEISAKAIQRAAMEVQVDPAALSAVTQATGDPVLALVAEFQKEMKAPEFAKWVHLDSDPALTAATATALRMRQVIGHFADTIGTGPAYDDLQAIKPHILVAYHTDPAIRAGLAQGLGLGDAGDNADPSDAMRHVARWAADTVSVFGPLADTHAKHAIAQVLPQLCTALGTVQDQPVARLTASMTLPQICIGLACLMAAPLAK